MFRVVLGAIALVGAAASVSAQTAFSKANISPVFVEYGNLAHDGCWTDYNGTVSSTANGLTRAGIPVGRENAQTSLLITVIAQRDVNGCRGAVSISHRGWATWDGEPAFVGFGDPFVAPFSGLPDANAFVLQTIQQFTAQNLAPLPARGS